MGSSKEQKLEFNTLIVYGLNNTKAQIKTQNKNN